MDKPKITGTKWYIRENFNNRMGVFSDFGGYTVNILLNIKDADAKAISACPEMIDVLLKHYKWLTAIPKGHHSVEKIQKWMMKMPNPEEAKQALLKAGVK